MKKVGVVVLWIGLSFTLMTTLDLLINEHVTDPARIELAQLKVRHRVWEPMVGTILILVGVGLYKVGKKDETKNHMEFRNL